VTRRATKIDSFNKIKDMGIPVSMVVDVGVMTGTSELMICFKDVPHLLFEPVEEHFGAIKRNYANLEYTLYPIALGRRKEEVAYAVSSVVGGTPTHARPAEGADKSARRIKVDKLDHYEDDLCPNFLLKIDVDGEELAVIAGAAEMLRYASVICIETNIYNIGERMGQLLVSGFDLFDIVDLCYYDNQFVQCDLIFVKSKFLKKPFYGDTFKIAKWQA